MNETRWRIKRFAWLVMVSCLLPIGRGSATAETIFYVATTGNDSWSGRLAEPNAAKSDGPFLTLQRGRDAVRALKAQGGLREPVAVVVRGGTHYLAEPLVLGPDDSGTEACPVVYRAYPGEKAILSGGRRIAGPWKSEDGKIFSTHLPEVQAGNWHFRDLRVGTERQIRARHPNFAPKDPYLGGYSHVAGPGYSDAGAGGFRTGLGCVQERGTWLEYDVEIPADGDYTVRLFYANSGDTNLRGWKTSDMSGRTTLSVDGGMDIPLADLASTGSFYKGFRWSRSASVPLTKGPHVLRWTNVEGGGLSLDAFLLCDDPDYEPPLFRAKPTTARPDRHEVILQAEKYNRKHGDLVTQMNFVDRHDPVLRACFQFEPGALKAWPLSPDAEIFVIPEYDWVSEIVRLASVDEATLTARVEGANATKPFLPGNRFYAANVLEALDTPGEWCLIRKTGMLYYQPKTPDFAEAEVVAPCLDRVIELRGDAEKERPVHHVAIEGFTIRDTHYTSPERLKDTYFPDDAAVQLWAASRCRIARNTFSDVGGYAIMLRDASTHNEIRENEIAGAGQGGIYLNGFAEVTRKPAPDGRRPADNLIAGNHVHDCGQFYVHVAGVYLACADRNRVAHNSTHNLPRYGISLKQNCSGNVIEYNEVRRTNLATRDTGAIEMADNKEGGIVRYNLVVDSVGCGFNAKKGAQCTPEDACGIYLDNMTSKVQVIGNIVARNAGGLWLNWGSENVIENNIFVESRDRQIVFNSWGDKSKWQTKDNRFRRNILCYTNAEASLYQLGNWDPHGGIVQTDHNLIWAGDAGPSILGLPGERGQTWAAWQKDGQDAQSVVAAPRFADAANDNFQLRADSPAFELGFKAIDVSKIGLRGYQDMK